MANCNEHFGKYNGEIRLTDARRKSLKGSRKELRKKVRNWFKENKFLAVFFGITAVIAGVLAFLCPGAGHFYQKRFFKAFKQPRGLFKAVSTELGRDREGDNTVAPDAGINL